MHQSRNASGAPETEASRSGTHRKGDVSEDGEEVEGGGAPREGATLRHLDEILRALPAAELESLVKRVGVRIDTQKRIDVASQVARALVGLPEIRDPGRLPPVAHALLLRVAEAQGLLQVGALPAGFEPLMARGILFGRRSANPRSPDATIEIVLPNAYLIQLPCWQNEDPRSMRALIAQAPFDTLNAIASHYLGRPATPPIALALETAWDALSDTRTMTDELERLPAVERRLLESIEAAGGEVETPELLDLEREPMRLRNAKGVSASRRGAGFALERRGFLIPIHPNRHVIPTEVVHIVGAERRASSSQNRANIRKDVLGEDHAPRRARFARDPSGIALAIAIGSREAASEVRPQVGTPRSLLFRLAQRFGRPTETISLVAALSRAVGLWEGSALSPTAPPGALTVAELAPLLFSTWRKGGAWDEARTDGEILRASPDQRDASPTRSLRDIVLDALADLGEDSWLPYRALERYAVLDPRFEGVDRLLRRWFERVGADRTEKGSSDRHGVERTVPEPVSVLRRVVLESLPVLGVIDVGADNESVLERINGGELETDQVLDALTIRLTARGRGFIAGTPPAQEAARSRFIDSQVLRVGGATPIAAALFLGHIAEVGRVEDGVDLVFSPPTIARAISLGTVADELRDRIEAVAPLPEGLSQILVQASVVVGKGSFVRASGFVWIEDEEVRELLRSRRTTQDLFVDPSPPAGLLIAADVDVERLLRRCRGLGVEIEVGPEGLVARTPDPGKSTTRPRAASTSSSQNRPPPTRGRTPFPRSRS